MRWRKKEGRFLGTQTRLWPLGGSPAMECRHWEGGRGSREILNLVAAVNILIRNLKTKKHSYLGKLAQGCKNSG